MGIRKICFQTGFEPYITIGNKFRHFTLIPLTEQTGLLDKRITDSSVGGKKDKLDIERLSNNASLLKVDSRAFKSSGNFEKKMNGIFAFIQTVLWRVIQYITDWCIAIIYRGPNDPLVPIREDCLLGSAKSLAARIRTRKITSAEAVRACIRRIQEINGTTNCIVANRFEAALKEAEAVDKFLAEETKTVEEIETDTPFLGVPFTTKDGIAVKGMMHAAGVVARKNEIAVEDAEVVELFRKSGAIPIALTNVPELMGWWETNSKLHGRANNPYHSKHMTGGSSGGEAAVIAAAGSLMGIGSDMGGSLRLPASFCGIFAHRPSIGLVPTKGHFPVEKKKSKIGVIGPLSKFSEDLKTMLKVLTKNAEILRLDEKVDIKKLQYFYMDDDTSNPMYSTVDAVSPEIKEAMSAVVEYFYKTYGITVQKIKLSQVKKASELWWAKICGDEGEELVPILKPANFAWEIIKIALGISEHSLEMITPALWQSRQPPARGKEQIYLAAQADKLAKEFQNLLGDNGVFFYPTSSTPAPKHGSSIFHAANAAYTMLFSATRMPVTQCPIKQTEDRLPIGIQIAAANHQDRLTLAVAEELEKAFGGWKPPPSQPKW